MNAVQRAVEQIRALILEGQLSPGEHVRQEDMAQQFGMSRVPIREALKALSSDGAILHRPNQGYFVAKMGEADVSQIYLMRRLLETEILRSIQWPDEVGLRRLRGLNDAMREAAHRDDTGQTITLNHDFHFTIFGLSPLNLITREVERIWTMSNAYRAVYHYDPVARVRITDEHDEIVKAIAEHDLDALVAWSDKHRGAAGDFVAARLHGTSGQRRPQLRGGALQPKDYSKD